MTRAVRRAPLPEDSLLARHARPGDHTDCYTADVPGEVSLADYVEAFYCSRGFLPERFALALIGRGATSADARALARGDADRFAAWHELARGECEVLLLDFLGRTCSWLAVKPLATGTRLCFGTGIVRRDGDRPRARAENAAFRALLPFHAGYSRVLLGAAARRLA